jgi:alpha-N-arabinofuranosidase
VVEVVIDARREVRTVPRTLFGVNVENMWNANGAWNPWKQAPNEELLGLAKGLNASLYRFPGGTLGDFYDWRDGVGPRAKRPKKQPITGEGDPQPNDFGTDEALDFAKRANGKLLISVNAGTGTSEDAEAWVRYVRERSAKDADQSVTWWEVGNELYHKGEDKASSVGMTPVEYAKKFLAFSKAMRTADPKIRVGAIGLENYGPYQFNSYRGWNETVLRQAGKEIDFFAVHNSYAPVGIPHDTDLRTAYATMLGAPELIRANLKTVSNQIDKHAGPRGKDIVIAVTEWGPLFHIDPKSPYILHTKTLGSALYTASVLKVYMETPRVEVATFFKLSDLNFMGLVGVREGMPLADYLKFEKGTFRATASYLAFQLLATRFERVLVSCKTDGPTFDTKVLGWKSSGCTTPARPWPGSATAPSSAT